MIRAPSSCLHDTLLLGVLVVLEAVQLGVEGRIGQFKGT
jgi:hypothetical protein